MTFDVLKLLTSRLTRLELPSNTENILSISVTFDVSKLLKSRLVRLEQPENIDLIFVRLGV